MKKALNINTRQIVLLFLLFAGSFSNTTSFAQTETIVSGAVTDVKSKQSLPGVTVSFDGTTAGTSTDADGHFTLRTAENVTRLKVTLIGCKTALLPISMNKVQFLTIRLNQEGHVLNEVVVRSGKKVKYSNKNNPAVELIRQVIAHKKSNRLEHYDYAEYQQYEKLTMYLGDLSDKFRAKNFFKNYQYLFMEQDSTQMGGKTLLPIYMEEKLSQNYFRKSPYSKKQIVEAHKQVKYDPQFIDNQGLQSGFNRMYQDIDIYDNIISLLGNDMLSPIAESAPTFYHFYITDTIKDVNPQLIELSFTPRSKSDLMFEGQIYITMDGNYAVQRAVLSVNKNINLNFVRQMKAILSFDKNIDGKYHLMQSDLKMDFGLRKDKGGVFGERVVMLKDFKTDHPEPDEIYKGPAVSTVPGAEQKADQYWNSNRPDSIKKIEAGIYKNIDSLQSSASFKRMMKLFTLLFAGYYDFGPFETGPTNTFYNFNPVEGFRLRFGGRTTPDLSKRYYFETYAAYGFKDEKFKYFLSGTYSLNDKSIYSFPQEYLRASFQQDTKIPGQELQFVQEDNFFLSFKRGINTTWLYNDIFRLNYVHEYPSHFSYKVQFQDWDQHPAGTLYYRNLINGVEQNITSLKTTELSAELRYAPNEKFYQGKLYRTPIPDKYPILTLRYQQGFQGLFDGQYNYENVTANITKRFYLGQFGYADVSTEGGYLFGKVPFPLLDIAHANQTYALQLQSYNLMNFLEFVNDHYAAVNVDQNFNGFIFNKIPALRKLKWREVLSFKALWGGVRNENNPVDDPSLYQFPKNSAGIPTTYALDNGPYMEASAGISNIFKVLRLDYVERLNYLQHPDAPKHGLRALVIFQF